jgi:hypothetical protein
MNRRSLFAVAAGVVLAPFVKLTKGEERKPYSIPLTGKEKKAIHDGLVKVREKHLAWKEERRQILSETAVAQARLNRLKKKVEGEKA